ncbi:hypothetical protein TNCV_752031 [Trichonephila clavipes]|uniref:Uncharacterized protein n=1 Tax=Trichonephila clavipes TaxID=2585209 RepID=A0A8X6WAP6_TRICX|nr:hypothetical protein TNCV_752031 [Trichonephila clavipes]
MVLKANDRRTSCPCHDEFRGPRSDYVRQAMFFLEKCPPTCPPFQSFKTDLLISVFKGEPNMFPVYRRIV